MLRDLQPFIPRKQHFFGDPSLLLQSGVLLLNHRQLLEIPPEQSYLPTDWAGPVANIAPEY